MFIKIATYYPVELAEKLRAVAAVTHKTQKDLLNEGLELILAREIKKRGIDCVVEDIIEQRKKNDQP